ncbi:MAG: hypothetical protein ACIWVG_31340 [Gloeotrichia echinulata HAB0833]
MNNTSSNSDTGEPKTYQARCWWCGEFVFHHTNGYGDYVMFDSLGYPWKIHKCWVHYWEAECKRRRVVNKIFDNVSTEHEMKCLSIKIVAASIPNVQVGEFNIYGAKESAIAEKMGYSIQEFRHHYGDVYDVNPDDEIVLKSVPFEKKRIEQTICYYCREYVNKDSLYSHRLHNCKFKKFRRRY